jgi:hypothetical protein
MSFKTCVICWLAVSLVTFIGCSEEDSSCGCGARGFAPEIVSADSPSPGAWAELVADRDPVVGGTATLTFRYEFRYDASLCDTVTLIAEGWFGRSMPNVFTYVHGESSWVDTVRCFERREHSVVIRALRRGELLLDAGVAAPVDSTFGLGGGDTVCICVK